VFILQHYVVYLFDGSSGYANDDLRGRCERYYREDRKRDVTRSNPPYDATSSTPRIGRHDYQQYTPPPDLTHSRVSSRERPHDQQAYLPPPYEHDRSAYDAGHSGFYSVHNVPYSLGNHRLPPADLGSSFLRPLHDLYNAPRCVVCGTELSYVGHGSTRGACSKCSRQRTALSVDLLSHHRISRSSNGSSNHSPIESHPQIGDYRTEDRCSPTITSNQIVNGYYRTKHNSPSPADSFGLSSANKNGTASKASNISTPRGDVQSTSYVSPRWGDAPFADYQATSRSHRRTGSDIDMSQFRQFADLNVDSSTNTNSLPRRPAVGGYVSRAAQV